MMVQSSELLRSLGEAAPPSSGFILEGEMRFDCIVTAERSLECAGDDLGHGKFVGLRRRQGNPTGRGPFGPA